MRSAPFLPAPLPGVGERAYGRHSLARLVKVLIKPSSHPIQSGQSAVYVTGQDVTLAHSVADGARFVTGQFQSSPLPAWLSLVEKVVYTFRHGYERDSYCRQS